MSNIEKASFRNDVAFCAKSKRFVAYLSNEPPIIYVQLFCNVSSESVFSLENGCPEIIFEPRFRPRITITPSIHASSMHHPCIIHHDIHHDIHPRINDNEEPSRRPPAIHQRPFMFKPFVAKVTVKHPTSGLVVGEPSKREQSLT